MSISDDKNARWSPKNSRSLREKMRSFGGAGGFACLFPKCPRKLRNEPREFIGAFQAPMNRTSSEVIPQRQLQGARQPGLAGHLTEREAPSGSTPGPLQFGWLLTSNASARNWKPDSSRSSANVFVQPEVPVLETRLIDGVANALLKSRTSPSLAA